MGQGTTASPFLLAIASSSLPERRSLTFVHLSTKFKNRLSASCTRTVVGLCHLPERRLRWLLGTIDLSPLCVAVEFRDPSAQYMAHGGHVIVSCCYMMAFAVPFVNGFLGILKRKVHDDLPFSWRIEMAAAIWRQLVLYISESLDTISSCGGVATEVMTTAQCAWL